MRTLIIALLFWSRAASAESPNVAAGRALFADGQALYTRGEFAAAAEKFDLAFSEDPDPAYVFNLGQARRLAQECSPAVEAYRTFLALVPDAPNRDEVTRYVHQMEECIENARPAKTPLPEPIEPPVDPPEPAAPGSGYSPAGIAIGVAGAALVGVGVWFGLDARSAANARESLCLAQDGCIWTVATGEEADDLADRGKRSSTVAVATIAAGGAAIVTGIVLNVLTRRSRVEHAVTVRVIGGGAVVVGTLPF